MTLLLPDPGPAPTALDGPGLPQRLAAARGPRSEHLLRHLTQPVHPLSPLPAGAGDPLTDGDTALALYLCYELHYLGLPGVDEAWEWEPSLLRERQVLERELEAALQVLVGLPPVGLTLDQTIEGLRGLATAGEGPSLSAYMRDDGTLEQMRELAVHRSAYQLKEADPHTWAIPRLSGRAKAGLVDIQRGEYGDGVMGDVHANLFAVVLDELDLRPGYGAYLDRLPGITLTTCNLVSLLGLHRRWRGALVGHLALFEMCSVVPMGRYRDALVRLGLDERATRFYEEHVIADAHHEDVALDEMVRGLLEQEPYLAGEVLFGARALAAVERLFTEHVLSRWADGQSSLLPPGR